MLRIIIIIIIIIIININIIIIALFIGENFDIHFPKRSLTDFVSTERVMPFTSAFTVCFSILPKETAGAILSYAVPDHANEFLIYSDDSGLRLFIKGPETG